MLVLTSRQGEDVIITVPGLDSPIIVRLIESGTGKARLGFQADASVTIDRAKVHQDKCRRRRGAGVAYKAIGQSQASAWEAIETHLREHPQPVQFVHDGWRWTIPSAGRGMICVPADAVASRRDMKRGDL
jgi:sRNA-binding carbon storage regulator CsrA